LRKIGKINKMCGTGKVFAKAVGISHSEACNMLHGASSSLEKITGEATVESSKGHGSSGEEDKGYTDLGDYFAGESSMSGYSEEPTLRYSISTAESSYSESQADYAEAA
jgi:hypothetical protein